jgi:hypothetical protein
VEFPADAIARHPWCTSTSCWPPYSALDNILLGAEPVRFGVIERKKARTTGSPARQYELPWI